MSRLWKQGWGRLGDASLPVKRAAGWVLALLVVSGLNAFAAEVIPPKPAGYFNDYAGVVSKEAAQRLNEKLAQFERETSNQVVVAVFRKMQSDSDIADYTQRIAKAWDIGQNDKRNGTALFVFIDDRKMFIQTAYGVEGALPDATCFDITERHIKPHFQRGDYEGGLAEGVDLICKALRGEYKGDGKTTAEKRARSDGGGMLIFVVCLVIFLIAMRLARRRKGYGYSGFGGPFIGGWTGGGGGWSGGSSSGGGFSGFSGGGGGGGFGGGGAGSSW